MPESPLARIRDAWSVLRGRKVAADPSMVVRGTFRTYASSTSSLTVNPGFSISAPVWTVGR